MFSQTAEYAFRAVVCLATYPGATLTTEQIAAATQVPEGYLAKVLQTLARRGLVRSRRGLHGGFGLARAATELTALQVLDAVDPILRITACPLGLPEHADELCPMHKRLDEAAALVE